MINNLTSRRVALILFQGKVALALMTDLIWYEMDSIRFSRVSGLSFPVRLPCGLKIFKIPQVGF
jgi:hypothetical protein